MSVSGFRATWLAAMLASSAACSSSRAVELDVVMAHGNCQPMHERVSRVTLAEVAKLRGTQLLGAEGADAGAAVSSPLLIAIGAGEKPTAGYRLSYDHATLTARTLVVTVRETSPPADAMTAQVITHPCLVLELPDDGFDTLRVVDDAGTVIGELAR